MDNLGSIGLAVFGLFWGTLALFGAWRMLAWLQPRFWPPARRQQRHRIRLRKTKDELRRDRIAEERSVGSRLSVKERRALHSLTDAEVEEALHIPQTSGSLKAPSSPDMTPPEAPQSSETTSSRSSSASRRGTSIPTTPTTGD